MEPNPCSKCGSTNLKPKWNSATGEGWVHCDNCGNVSTALPVEKGRDALISQWNTENPPKA